MMSQPQIGKLRFFATFWATVTRRHYNFVSGRRKGRRTHPVGSSVRRRTKIIASLAAGLMVALLVRSWLYDRYKNTCESIEVGTDLDDASDDLEGAGGKHVAKINDEHQWLRVRLSFKHQLCRVTVDAKEKVVSVKYEDSWDLL